MQYRKLVKGAIRLPIIFVGLNIMLKCKKQTNITFFVKLSILNYRCPGVTYITNFTRMPHLWQYYETICCVAAWKVDKIFSKNSGFIILSPSPDVYGTYSPDWSPVAHFSKSNPSWAEQEKQESMRKNSLMAVCFCWAHQFSVIYL